MTAPSAAWLDVPGLAALLGVPESWVYERTAARSIPFHKVGRYVRFTPADVAAIEKQTAQVPADRRLRSTA
jgi:excisionase family DNA binding protein